MEPWYKVTLPRPEVREGRSFNPDEFAIALEQVVAGTAPLDYRDPVQFFSRTCFTRALREHAGRVLRRLAGKTENSAPVLTLITQFGGGKTHTLASLYHLVQHGKQVADHEGVANLVREAGLSELPSAKVAVFVGNAWDPQEGHETPWLDIARWLAGDTGVAALGTVAKTTPTGTESIGRLIQVAGGSVLLLFDAVLNFLNRHRSMAESFHAFLQNLTVAMTGTSCGAAVISLPRLAAAIDADIAGAQSHARALDADSKGTLKDIHRRVGATILFESSGGQGDKVAHLPELRFALGEPEVDTTSIDNAAVALETKGFYIRRAGSDGFRFGFNPTLKKVVSDRRASLDDDEVKKAAQTLVKKEFERGAALPLIPFPEDGSAVQDTPKLTLVVLDPESEWDLEQAGPSSQAGSLRHKIAEWTKQRGKSPRLYPGSLVWCVRKPGRDLKEKIEVWLAWKRVEKHSPQRRLLSMPTSIC